MDRDQLRMLIGEDLTLRHAAWLCVIASLALSAFGLYAIELGANSAGDPGIELRGNVLKQAIFLAVGLLAAVAVAVPHYRLARLFAWPALVLVLGLLVVLLIPQMPSAIVRPINGARSWIILGPFRFQPSEIAKVAFVIVIADYLRNRVQHRRFFGLLPPALIAAAPIGLITLQPDLGTAGLFAPALLAMLIAAGAKLKHLAIVLGLAVAAGPAVYPLLKPHQRARIEGIFRAARGSEERALDEDFQHFTAVRIAGAGKVEGQTDEQTRLFVRYNALPEAHTDMVYAVLVNRFGFAGGLIILGLYGMWLLGAFITAAFCRDPFGRLVVIGCAAILAAQVFINVGMNVGLLPIIGITLPYVSYGGASLITMWIMTGLVFGVATRRPSRFARPSFEFADEDE